MVLENETCTCDQLFNVQAIWSDADCFVVITGASRGFGRALCVELVNAMSSGTDCPASLTIFLMSQNLTAMENTKSEVKTIFLAKF